MVVVLERAAVVFIHGLFSSGHTWQRFIQLLGADPEFAGLAMLTFDYSSPKFSLNPLRRIPNYGVLADNLRTYLDVEAADYQHLVLVSHSQGGLIVQRFLARMVTNSRGHELRRIRRVVMFACPNFGSEIFAVARRRAWFWRHPQERELRPINENVAETHQIVLSRIIHARQAADDRCPIPMFAYAGESDNIVTPTSARSVFPNTGVIPGDHFSVIRPSSMSHRSYTTLKMNLLAAMAPSDGDEALGTPFHQKQRHPREPSLAATDRTPMLRRLSTDLTADLGRRRTAYPLDMSLAELYRMDLFVAGRLARYHERDLAAGTPAVATVVTTLISGRSVLLLGEPGSGKSLSLYVVAMALRRAGKWPLPVRAMEAESLLASAEWQALAEGPLADAVVLIDGLDEAVELASGGTLGATMRELARRAPMLITSRTREYEELLVFETTVSFDEVFVLEGWRVEAEFADYLGRLSRRGLVESPQLYRTVVASEHLVRLVARPLYARMLTFIGRSAASRALDTAGLYGAYLTRLGEAADFALREAFPQWSGSAIDTWQAAAAYVYEHGASADAVPMAELGLALSTAGAPALRVLDQVLDRRGLHGMEIGEFLHYSFYEYLLARHVRDRLRSRLSADEVVRLLHRDLTREVRHHLIGQLREPADDQLGARLGDLYREVRSTPHLAIADVLTVCNLLVYLMSRLDPAAPRRLAALLLGERDGFLLNSILWALCHLGSDQALDRFTALLREDRDFRAGSRGYVLYYYGDLQAGRPPFLDVPPYGSHERSSRRVPAMFSDRDFQAVPIQRRYIDIYTFLDIYLVRGEVVDERVLPVLRAAVESVTRGEIRQDIKDQLNHMLRDVAGRT